VGGGDDTAGVVAEQHRQTIRRLHDAGHAGLIGPTGVGRWRLVGVLVDGFGAQHGGAVHLLQPGGFGGQPSAAHSSARFMITASAPSPLARPRLKRA
jgi:hypothetical protein